MKILHCIYDPFCGWCYGSAPLLQAAVGIEGLTIQLHGGGMMAGARRQRVTEALRAFVMQHDRRIAAMSGQTFGEGYQEGLLRDTGAVFDSEPPTTALIAAKAFGKDVELLDRIQRAHFIDGRRIADPAVLEELAEAAGIRKQAFRAEYARVAGESTGRHIHESLALLDRVDGEGFPTFALEDEGTFTLLPSSRFLKRPEEWREFLRGSI